MKGETFQIGYHWSLSNAQDVLPVITGSGGEVDTSPPIDRKIGYSTSQSKGAGLTKNGYHTLFIHEKMLIILFHTSS